MTTLKHSETGEAIETEIVSMTGNWLTCDDGYVYDLRYWSIQ